MLPAYVVKVGGRAKTSGGMVAGNGGVLAGRFLVEGQR